MKTKIILLLTMMIGSFILNSLIPIWWIFVIVVGSCGYFLPKEKSYSFAIGFVAIFLLWLGYAWFIDVQNQQLLSHRITLLFHLPNAFSLIVITSILGGIIGGLASWAGYNIKMAFQKI